MVMPEGDAGGGGQHVPGLVGCAPGKVLGGRDDRDDVDWRLEERRGARHADGRGPPAHVEFHLVHLPGRLQGDSARVEGDPLAHDTDGAGSFVGRPVLQHDQPGLVAAPPPHAQDRSHLRLLQLPRAPDGAFESDLPRHLPGGVGEKLGRMIGARAIGEIAGEENALGHHASLPCAFPHLPDLGRIALDEGQPGESFAAGLCVGLVLREAVPSQTGSLYHGLGRVPRGGSPRAGPVGHAHQPADAQPPGPLGRCSRGLARPIENELLLLAQPDDQDPFRPHPPGGAEEERLVQLPLEVPVLQIGGEEPARGSVDRAAGASRSLGAFE
jgi:hypothetical protein